MASPLVKTLLIVGLGGGALYLATRPQEEEAAAPPEEQGWGGGGSGGGGGDFGMTPPPGDQMLDSDGDGVPDVYDVFPNDPARTGYETPDDPSRQDRDNDGVPDHIDVYPDAGGKTGYEPYKASFWEGPVGSNLAFAGVLAGTTLAGKGAQAAWRAVRAPKVPKLPKAPKVPKLPAGARIRLAPRISNALTRLSGIRPAAKGARLLPKVARGAGRIAVPLYVAEGIYTAGRNIFDMGKAGLSGDREKVLDASSRAVQRGTQFLTLGIANVNIRQQRIKIFGRKVVSW